MNYDELKRLCHIDDDDEGENAVVYQGMAEAYLANAGCTVDYTQGTSKGIIVAMVTKMLDSPDLLTNLQENTGFTLNGMIAQLRISQMTESCDADA